MPHAKKQKNGKRKSRKSTIHTDTPEKTRLKEIEQEQIKKEKKNRRGKLLTSRNLDVSSSNTDQLICLESKNYISDEFSEEENTIEPFQDEDIINETDYLLVKFSLKSSVIYAIGIVLEVVNLNEHVVTFLRRKAPEYKFYFPQVDDISTDDRCDIILNYLNLIQQKLLEHLHCCLLKLIFLCITSANFLIYILKYSYKNINYLK